MTTAAALDRLGIDPAAVEAALDADRTFPARWYSDPSIYDLELDAVFTRSWVIAGSLDRLAKSADHLVSRVAHVPVLVTRARDGALHGFVNVCRHRAYPVATEDGCRQLLQCAYHAWTYELDGRLNRAPRAEAEPGFDKADFSLVRSPSTPGARWSGSTPIRMPGRCARRIPSSRRSPRSTASTSPG